MPEENQNFKQHFSEEDEIDLYELWLTIKKRWKTVSVTTFIFFIFAVFYIISARPVYKSDFVIKNVVLSSKEIEIYLNKITNLINNKKYDILSNVLDIDKNLAKNIEDIKVVQNKKNKGFIKIELYTYSNKNLIPLEKAVLNYLNENKYVQKKIDLEKKKILSIIKAMNNTIENIIYTKKTIINKLENNLSSIRFDPADIDIKILNLEKQKIELKNRLKNLGFEIKVPVSKPFKPYKPKKVLILVVSIVTGLILGIFLVFFLEWIDGAKRNYRLKEEQV